MGLLVERIHGYSLFRGLLDVVPRLVTPASFPLLRLAEGLMYEPLPGDSTYGILNRPATLFAYFLVMVAHIASFLSPILLPIGLVRPSTWMVVTGAVGLGISTAIHAVTGLSQATVESGDFPVAAGWEQMRHTLRRRPGLFLKRFLLSWVASPLTSIKAAVTIFLLALAHWPAWAFARPHGRRMDLADKGSRDRYYAVISVLTVLAGTVLMGLAETLWR
jgi:hypothetical protein